MLRRQRMLAMRSRRRAAISAHRLRESRRLRLSPPSRRRPTVVLQLPSVINAEKDDKRASILNIVDSTLAGLSRDRSIKLDFSRVIHIFPGGMLILLAFLERLLASYPGRIRASCRPGSMSAQLLHHFGYGTALKVPLARNQPCHASVINWRHATGCEAEGHKVQEQIDHFERQVGHAMPEGLYDVLTEAMINTRHHAYQGMEVPEDMRRWWMFSSCREPDCDLPGNLYIGLYDMGVGIPEKLRRKLVGVAEHVKAGINRLMANFGQRDFTDQDCQLLGLAIDENRSSTGLTFRGLGLPEMKEFASKTPGGRMTIISGHGLYRFHSGWDTPKVTRCDPPLSGTLILWNLPLTWTEPTP